jgi:N-acetylglucosaminyl-diphospho-decaprenol L-rhamnosyltransferase
MRVAAITLASASRAGHVRVQQRFLRELDVDRIVVWLDPEATGAAAALGAEGAEGATIVHVPPGRDGLRLAAGRNAGAERALAAGADLLLFLDADCLPGRDLLARYRGAVEAAPGALLAGPVTYLPQGAPVRTVDDLMEATAPHPARPDPPDGELVVGDRYELFWSLSFAMTAAAWDRLGGFDEGYEGYGGEDTDFAFRARSAGVPLIWVGGAHAYHQHHPTQSPPVQHLDDILRNGRRFADRWGEWPMRGWLDAFLDTGLIVADSEGYRRSTP